MTRNKILELVQNTPCSGYDSSLIIDTVVNKNITLICEMHGEFNIRLDHVKEGKICPNCAKNKLKDKKWDLFIEKANIIHNSKYDYIRPDDFNGNTSKIRILCPIHGEFLQTGVNHLQGQGCHQCYFDSQKGNYKMTTDEFICQAKKVHGDKYDYSQTVYNGQGNKLKITCPSHGEFLQIAYDHLRGFGCKQCKFDKSRLTRDEFIQKSIKIHGDKFTYEHAVYVTNNTPITITCKTHGDFSTHPAWILMGMGCPFCKSSRLENEVRQRLIDENINFIQHAKKSDLPWLEKLSLDFYLPNNKLAVECQGAQHFKPIKQFGDITSYEQRNERDIRKRKLCEENGVLLLYYTHEKNTPYECYRDINILLEKIRSC